MDNPAMAHSSPIHCFTRRTSSLGTCLRLYQFHKKWVNPLCLCGVIKLKHFLFSLFTLCVFRTFFVNWRRTQTILSLWDGVSWREWVGCYILCCSDWIHYWIDYSNIIFMFLRWRICRSMRSTVRTSLALSLYGDSALTALSSRSSYFTRH